MAQYINKSALVTDIEKLNPPFYPTLAEKMSYQDATKDCIDIIYTLKVKEADLEKIINDYFKDWKFDDELDIMVKPNNYSASFIDLKDIAKYFFELGMRVSNEAQKGE